MKLDKIYAVLEGVSPKAVSDEYCAKYGAYDNSGILIDCGKEIEKVLFSLDFSVGAIERAEEIGANLIVTHHPAIYSKIGDVLCSTPSGKCLQRAIQNNISVISMHLNFDCAKEGIDYYFMSGMGGTNGKILEPLQEEGLGYGRVYSLPETTAGELVNRIKKEFNAKQVLCYGEDKKVKKAASFCGAGADEGNVLKAVKENADCIISSDFKHHVITMALEYGLAVIAPTHYAVENYGFNKIYQNIKDKLNVESEYFYDERLL